MLREPITYTDLNGETHTEDFYFNLTKAEIAKMELSVNGGMSEKLKKIHATNDVPSMIDFFEDLIKRSYGVKTADGRFIKRAEDFEIFASSEAYSEFFMKLLTDAEAAANFVNRIIPADLAAQVNSQTNVPATN